MRAVELVGQFGLENLALVERPRPEPGPGQVLLRMRAAALNYRDLLMVRGQYDPRQALPLVPCSDGVGQVAAVGPGVEDVRQGDRVAPIFAQRWLSGRPSRRDLRSTLGGPLGGTLCEYMVLGAEGVVQVPDHLTDEEAATLPCAALTAWNAVVTHGGVVAGDTVLVQGTGGVSIFALQIATLLGARVIVTSKDDEKLEKARNLGAAETINYRKFPDWGPRAAKLSRGEGVDLVVEVGGSGTLDQSLLAVRPGGRVALIGVLAGGVGELAIHRIFMREVRVQGIFVGHRESFRAMNRAIDAHSLRPAIHRVFALEQAQEALEYLAAAEHFGKVCIRIA